VLRLIDISKARPTRVASPCDIPTRLPGWDNRDTVRPTTFMMTTAMTGVMVALIEGKRFMLCGLDAEKRSGAPKMHPIEARQFLERYIARYQGQPSHIEVLLQTITAMQCYRTALSMCLERDKVPQQANEGQRQPSVRDHVGPCDGASQGPAL
jgi:hypothetical protein